MSVASLAWRKTGVFCGPGSLERLGPELASRLGTAPKKVAIFTGHSSFERLGLGADFRRVLGGHQLSVHAGFGANPTMEQCDRCASQIRNGGYDAVIAVGGGSVIDTVKTANFAAAAGSTAELLKNAPAKGLAPVFVAVPTTAGTGSEVTQFATVWDFTARKKLSFENAEAAPELAILEPRLTVSQPAALTQATALDAFGHALESFWNKRATEESDRFALEAMSLHRAHYDTVLANPSDLFAREGLQRAALLAGMAISVTRTAAAHALSYYLTLEHGIDHGMAVGIFLPAVLRKNFPALGERGPALLRACGMPSADACAALVAREVMTEPFREAVKACSFDAAAVAKMAEFARVYGRLDNNVKALTDSDVKAILEEALLA